MKTRAYPCPHNRLLTDRELERIFNAGWAQWKAEQDRERRAQESGPDFNDPDWWKK